MTSLTDTPPPDGQSKVCRICREAKPLSAFYRKLREPDGLETRCAECVAAYMRDYWAKNPEKRKGLERNYEPRRRELYAENQDSRRARGRERYWADVEKSRADARRRYHARRNREAGRE